MVLSFSSMGTSIFVITTPTTHKFLSKTALLPSVWYFRFSYLQDIQGAIDAYSESLRLEPHNLEAKYNLEMLLLQSGGNGSGKPIVVPGSSQQRDQGI